MTACAACLAPTDPPLDGALRLCAACRLACEHPEPKVRVAKWGLSALRRAYAYSRETGDPAAPFLSTVSPGEVRTNHLHGFASQDALAVARTEVERSADSLQAYACAFWGEALLFNVGARGAKPAMLMGLLVEPDDQGGRFRDRPTSYVGVESWLP